MVKIAICDDDENAICLHDKIVRNSLQDCGIGYEITHYAQSNNLLYDITDDGVFYDLLLLDIEMPVVNGMALSKRIKTCLSNVKIIFITSHMEYALDAFELSIFRYIPKSSLERKLPAAVKDAAKLIELEVGKEYLICTANRMEKIPLNDIFYIMRDGKNACIVSGQGTTKVRKSLQKVFEELSTSEFLFVDRGYIVNIIHIMKISNGMAVLKNGEQLPISRAHLQEVKQAINKFWGAHI